MAFAMVGKELKKQKSIYKVLMPSTSIIKLPNSYGLMKDHDSILLPLVAKVQVEVHKVYLN